MATKNSWPREPARRAMNAELGGRGTARVGRPCNGGQEGAVRPIVERGVHSDENITWLRGVENGRLDNHVPERNQLSVRFHVSEWEDI